MYRVLRSFSVFSPPPSPLAAPGLQGMEDYYQALEQLEERNLEKTRESLKIAINKLSIGRRDDYASFAVASSLLAKTQCEGGMFSEAENTLKSVVGRLEKTKDQELYTRACLNLFIQYLHSNVPEAVAFSRGMLELSNWSRLHPSSHADWHYLHGV